MQTWLWATALLLMGLCVIATAWFPLLSIPSLPSNNYNEGWNAYRQWMALQDQPLYATAPGLWTTNYPFLSFHIVGLLAGTEASMVPVARTLCFCSLVASGIFIASIIHEVTGSLKAACYAGLCLFVWLACFYGAGRASDDPEMLSLAFTSVGLFSYFKASFGRRIWLILSAFAFALSLFTKHDQIAIPLSVAVYLLITLNWRAFAIFAGSGLIAAGLLLNLSYHLDGPYFFAELLQKRAYSLQNLASETLHYLLHFFVPLLIGAAVLFFDREIPQRKFLLTLLICTNLIAIYFSGGDGVASNVFYPPVVAVLLTCIISICRLEQNALRPKFFARSLALTTLAGAAMVPSQLHIDIAAQLRMPAATLAAQQAIARLQATTGPAICEDLLLCYRAGKPLGYDPYYVKDQILIGRLPESSILAALDLHYYAAIQIDSTMPHALLQLRHGGRFTKPFLLALSSQYHPVLANHFYSVFVPGAPGPSVNLSRITKARAAGG